VAAGAALLSPASMAGLLVSRAIVWVGPPLGANVPNPTEAGLRLSPVLLVALKPLLLPMGS
jgi:hypothetical protein